MKLDGLLSAMPRPLTVSGAVGELRVEGIACDSRQVKRGDVFFAFAGQNHPADRFVGAAVEMGAVAIVSEEETQADFGVPWIRVSHGRRALGAATVAWYADCLRIARLIGITGTNGKTTTAWLVDAILRAGGAPTGLIGTVRYQVGNQPLPAPNTTPDSLDVMRMVEQVVAMGGHYLTMEVSSHALALGRVHAIPYEVAAFTNFTQDHLDFHGTEERYYDAKCQLFAPERAEPPKVAVLNADDTQASKTPLVASTDAVRFGLNETATLRAMNVDSGLHGLRFDVEWHGKRRPLHSPLIGEFNAYNLLAAYGICLALGISREQIHDVLAVTREVPGRFERVDSGQPFAVVVDYAHTPDALRNVLQTARRLKPHRVITVFGCGGDRDRSKRPRMAEAVASLSEMVVLTSDNPRTEDPLHILNDALVGLQRFDIPYTVEPDRKAAIQKAIAAAEPGDLVLIAGKGHENYQIFADRTIHFDDREEAIAALAARGFATAAEGGQ
ncbi:MAG: UDP-N-acetylmuramoyl-L-alanyl-D-glutamate--2,6-diaminopimelate ligase [Bryobacterales bacterium]|nr:UDP-N-acetylmuramoyl-L-alanyl-D-glutamate--2,6-diaminopimelate ligase [Bryobacterales bacterium]